MAGVSPSAWTVTHDNRQCLTSSPVIRSRSTDSIDPLSTTLDGPRPVKWWTTTTVPPADHELARGAPAPPPGRDPRPAWIGETPPLWSHGAGPFSPSPSPPWTLTAAPGAGTSSPSPPG